MENQTSDTPHETGPRLFTAADNQFKGLSEVMTGMSLFGQVVGPDASLLAFLIMKERNQLQQYVAAFLFHHQQKRLVDNASDADKDIAWKLLEVVQDNLRTTISGLFSMDAQDWRFDQRARRDERLQAALAEHKDKYKDVNKPHAQGTVAELAQKLGVSKSEVRRLKTEGKLEQALEALDA